MDCLKCKSALRNIMARPRPKALLEALEKVRCVVGESRCLRLGADTDLEAPSQCVAMPRHT